MIDEGFDYGKITYLYYLYLEDFHVEPQTFDDLFERGAYRGVRNKVDKFIMDMTRKERRDG